VNDEELMRHVIEATREAINNGQTPFGACIVKDGEIIGLHNATWDSGDATNHAEVEAIRKASRVLGTADLSECVAYSTCAPCSMCFSAYHWARIPKIYYGVSLATSIEVGLGDLPISPETMKDLAKSPIEIVGEFLVEENQELFKFWAEHGSFGGR
jgi:guanine deaminase